MKPSRIVLLLVAILAGGLAAYLATQGGSPPPAEIADQPEVIQEARERILIATVPIGVGERLSTENVQWFDWPEGAVRSEYITARAEPDALETIGGAVARFEIFPGDPIVTSKLVRSEQGYLSAVLDKGKRGVSIAVNADSASGGFIVPNDHIDVVLTRPGLTGQVSETILRNVKVLAIGNRLGETGATGGPEDPEDPRAEVFADQAIATLELDPTQAETVINAGKIGSLSLALRSIADFAPNQDEVINAPNSRSVRVIKFGTETSVLTGSIDGTSGASASAADDPMDDLPPGATIDPATGAVIMPAPTGD